MGWRSPIDRSVEGLDTWVATATRGLCAPAAERVAAEVRDHHALVYEELLTSGATPREAEAAALAWLGSARAARRRFHREYLTAREAKVLLSLQGKRDPNRLGRRSMSRGRWASMIAALFMGVWLPLYVFPSPYATAFMACLSAVLVLVLLHALPSRWLDNRVQGHHALLLRMLLLHALQFMTLPLLIGMLTGAFDRVAATLPGGDNVLPIAAATVLAFQLPLFLWQGRLTWKLMADTAGVLYRDLLDVAWRRHPARNWWERTRAGEGDAA